MVLNVDRILNNIKMIFQLNQDVIDELARNLHESKASVEKMLKNEAGITEEKHINQYINYWSFLKNKIYFCGPGPNKSKDAKYDDNLGELCRDFGPKNVELIGKNWIKHSEL